MGETHNESVEAAKKHRRERAAPSRVTAYVTGPSALIADTHIAGDRSLQLITGLTFNVITVMLLFVYRSIVTVVLALIMVFLELAAARRVVFAGHHHVIQLSIRGEPADHDGDRGGDRLRDLPVRPPARKPAAEEWTRSRPATTDVPRDGARHPRESGLTIAGAMLCACTSPAARCSIRWSPAVHRHAGGRHRRADAGPGGRHGRQHAAMPGTKRAIRVRFLASDRHGGRAVARAHPGRHRCAVPGRAAGPAWIPHRLQRRHYLPPDIPASGGLRGGERHFPSARLSPGTLLMIESDHDMRNSADFLVIDRVLSMFHQPGIARVQTITRPLGTPPNTVRFRS